MNDSSATDSPLSPMGLSIAAVERETGLSKDILRVWERRYGFPVPCRDRFGERRYGPEQVDKLRLIRRLLDQGLRPGRIVRESLEHLRALAGGASAPSLPVEHPATARLFFDLKESRIESFQAEARALATALGPVRFAMEVATPLGWRLGEEWAAGRLEVFEEHAATEVVAAVLRAAIERVQEPAREPRVLLTTLPGERHGLGLLAAEAAFALAGCVRVSLGADVPIGDIATAARANRVDIVAIGASAAMVPAAVREGLSELRLMLHEDCELWLGGATAATRRRPPEGVRRIASLDAVESEVRRWREARGEARSGGDRPGAA